jgi:hypothetical protein
VEVVFRVFAAVLRRFLPAYRQKHRLNRAQRKAVRAIQVCKTPALGGHEYHCGRCGRTQRIYHGCRNRLCPQCQGLNSARWIETQQSKLLPVRYYQAVFTVASELRLLFAYNRRLLYDLLFRISSETIQTFAEDPRWLGARPGFVGILHTWGQQLTLHPHIHYMLTGGGVDAAGRWVNPRQPIPFLFPVVAMSERFRDRFLDAIQRLHQRDKLILPPGLNFATAMETARGKAWEVYLQPPVAGADKLLRYLGRYTHRVAIHPSRILAVDAHTVRLSYRDYRQGGMTKEMKLPGVEFVGRFLQHVLPEGFRRIRHYGLWSGNQHALLERIREQLQSQTALVVALLAQIPTPVASAIVADGPPCPACRQAMCMGLALAPQPVDSS